ncbi:MAG: FHA domain-containing protein [Elusimicrobiota bacterium]
MIRLYLKNKAEVIKEYKTKKKEIKVGRSRKNHIVIDNKHVSDRHCVIRKTETGYEVEDLNTSFGTLLKGKKINREKIEPGDELKIGDYSLKICTSSSLSKQPFLIGIQGKMDGRKFELGAGETKIGRSREFNNIWISKELDKSVSRRHATITNDGKKYILTDKRSRNRTFVNQRQVNEKDEIHLKTGDEILIGKSIFRFVTGGNENYSHPKKAGIFWTRIIPKFRFSLFMVFLIAGTYMILNGLRGISLIEEQPEQHFLRKSDWQPEALKTYEEGFSLDGNLDITPSPAIGDVSGDGYNEIIMSAPNGEIYVWNRSGKLLWTKKIGQNTLTSPQLADINGNRVKDIIVGSDDSRVYVLDGRSGHLIYRSPFLGGKLLFASSVLVADLDMNGFKDIVAVTDDNVVGFIYSPLIGGRQPYYFQTAEQIMSSPVLLKSGGLQYVVVPTNGGQIYYFEADNPENRHVVDFTKEINMYEGLSLVLNEINTVPAVADLNNSGNDELICATGAYFMGAISGDGRGELHWLYRIQPFSMLEAPLRYASPVVSDFTGNGLADIALAWANGNIMAVEGRSGRELWSFSLEGEQNRIIASLALADFTKNGTPDPVVATEDGSVFILDGKSGREADPVLSSAKMNAPVTATPAVGDILSNGHLDVVVVSTDGNISLFETSTRVFKNHIAWSNFRNSSHNSGFMPSDDKRDYYNLFVAVGLFLIASAGFAAIVIKIKRKKKDRPG